MSKGVKKKGFTLVELVVVLAIFGLLASITGLGLYSWTRYSINKENNENARTIFLAAQESLTHMQASGTLSEYSNLVVSDADKTPTASISPEISENISDRLYTIFYAPGSLEYRTLNTNELVRKMLSPYLEGTGVFNHAFAIEFDPRDGVVYSVFYSKKADSLEYETDGNTKESGIVGIAKRDAGTLKDRLLGYYAADLTAAKPTQLPVAYIESSEPLSTKTQLINAEELYYRISFDDLGINNKSELLSSVTSFEIDIYDPNVSAPMIKIQTTGTELKEKLDSINSGLVLYTIDYKKNDNNGSGDGQYKTQIKMNLRTEISDEDKYIKVVFDSIDVNTINKLTSSNITFSYDGSKINGFKNYDDSFSDTYSIFNLLRGLKEKNSEIRTVGFDSFYCKYIINVGGTEKEPTQPSNTENYLFKSFKENDNNSIHIEISNIRHLFNICYIEKINNTTNRKITYKQVNSFDYYGKYIFSSINSYASPTIADGFPTIKKFGSKSTYDASENSNSNYSINKLVLNSKVLDSYTDESQNSIYKYNLGIFAENYGTIKNLELNGASLINYKPEADNSNVDNSNNTTNGSGIITAVNNGIIENCKVSGSITGEVNIGGIAGINKSKIKSCVSEVSINPGSNKSYNLGGIAGLMTGNQGYPVQENDINSYIIDCEYIPNNCLSEEILLSKNNPKNPIKKENIKGYHIGGILGESKGIALVKNCRTTTDKEGYIIGYNSVGGIVGICDNNLWLSSTYSEQSRGVYNEANIIGSDCVGGVIGNIANTNEGTEKTFSNLENKGAIVVKITDNNGNTVGSYGGGITASINKNTTIYNCLSNVESTNVKQLLSKEYSDNNVVGGLVGVLRGKIKSSEIIEHKVLVGGGDNVGGLVGYCYSDSEIINQRIISGYVFGGNNVGGLIGYNELKLYGNGIHSNFFENSLDLVSGDNNVGGLLGCSTQELNSSAIYTHSINLVEGKKNVGGLVGYGNINIFNQCVKARVSGTENVGGVIGENKQNIQIYIEQEVFNEVNVKGINNVGGIAGINSGSIYDVFVKGTVEATEENGGGFAGINNANAKIQNNKNGISKITVSGKNKIGGISGTNNGEIYNLSFGGEINAKGDNVGGITGVNNNKVQIDGAKTINVSVTGRHNVGGIVGDNNNEIYDLSVNATVDAKGNNAGGIAGINKGKIQLKEQYKNVINVSGVNNVGGIVGHNSVIDEHNIGMVSNALVGGSVVAREDCVGGVVGKNDGTVSEIAVSEITVNGRDYVGGYVGKNNNYIRNISDISNIQITGKNVVGGLFGYTKISNWICENISLDKITVTGNDFVGGFAGQIVSNNNINQIYCKVNNSSIYGVNYVSGIYGQLTKYDVDSISIKGEVKNTNISGSNYVAGVLPLVEENVYISQYNVTLLDNVNITILDNVNITISNNENNIYCGLVSAVNNGEIFNTTITNSTINGTSDSYIGGIAGINYGKIESSKVVQSVIKYGDISSAGFISGINEGIIQDSGVYSNSYIPKENTTFSTVYLGDITGINGSLFVLDGNKMAKISNCKSVNLISEGNQREIGIAGINLAKIEKTSLFNDSNQNLVDTAWNSYGKRSELTINEPVRNENGDLTISFSGYNSNVSNFKLIISVLDIKDGNIVSNNVYSAEGGDVTCDSQNQSCTYILSSDKVKGNNGFVVYVENLDDRTESSINNLSSISASSYYYDIPLSTVDFEVTNENNLFKITYTPLKGDIANYIDKYQLKYQIDDSSVNIVDFTDNYIQLNSITGNNVQFAVIAVPKSEYVFYAESKTVWKTYSIANISSIENNIAEVNDNIEVSENQNIGVENE